MVQARTRWLTSWRPVATVVAVGVLAAMAASLGRGSSGRQTAAVRQEKLSATLERIEQALIAAEENVEQDQPDAARQSLSDAERELAAITAQGPDAAGDPRVVALQGRLERVRRLLTPAGPGGSVTTAKGPGPSLPTKGSGPAPPWKSGASGLAPSPYPRFQVDQFSRGQSRYRGPQTNRLKWRLPMARGASAGSPALGPDGTIYFGDSQSTFYAVAPDGRIRWTFRLPPAPPPTIGRYSGKRLPPEEQKEWGSLGLGGKIMHAPAVAADGIIYFGVSEGTSGQRLFALRPDGTEQWSFKTDADIVSSPNISPAGVIYFVAEFALYAVKPDGTLSWRFSLEKTRRYATWSNPAIGEDGTVYVVGGKLYAIGPDGRERWAYADPGLASAFAAHPTLGPEPDRLIYVAAKRDVYAVRPDGRLKWRRTIGWTETAPALGSNGVLYVGTGTVEGQKAAFFAISAADGTVKWTFPIKVAVDSSPVVGADATIYFGSDDGYLYALDAAGRLKWQFFLGQKGEVDMAPVIGADGTLYFSTLVGDNQGLAFFAIADK